MDAEQTNGVKGRNTESYAGYTRFEIELEVGSHFKRSYSDPHFRGTICS